MKLTEWQKIRKINNTELARLFGVHPSYITYLKRMQRTPSLALACKIQEITGGKVRVEDLYPGNQ
uniref:Putative antitoxin n=1 Tax=viral metagenome TaxID=1070528 RepID=A0A6M3K810_9ZZZZ